MGGKRDYRLLFKITWNFFVCKFSLLYNSFGPSVCNAREDNTILFSLSSARGLFSLWCAMINDLLKKNFFIFMKLQFFSEKTLWTTFPYTRKKLYISVNSEVLCYTHKVLSLIIFVNKWNISNSQLSKNCCKIIYKITLIQKCKTSYTFN